MVCRVALAVLLAAATVAAAGQPQQSFWQFTVNGVPKGDVLAALDGDDVWMPIVALEQAGLKGFEGRRETLFGGPHVLLNSLAPNVTHFLDLSEIIINITADPRFFELNVVVLQRDRPDGIVYSHSASGYVNYSATWDQTAGTTGYGEAGLALFGNTSAVSGFNVGAEGRFVRGLSTLSVDRASARQRLQVGDLVTQAAPLGSAPIMVGASFSKNYGLDPYYYRFATPVVRGNATAPSDVEIYVNGALVRRMRIDPGPYRFDRLPLNAGLGDIRVVVRDPLGRQQIYQANVYLAAGVLRKGEQDYEYAAGKLRDDTGVYPTYGDWQGSVTHRIGVTDWFTVGYAGEGNQDVVTGGPTLAARLSRLGEVEVNAWVSQTKDKTRGLGVYGLYTFVGRWLNLSATAQYYNPGFANIYLNPGGASTPEYYQASAGVPIFSLGSMTYSWEAKRSPAGTFGFTLDDGFFDPEITRSEAHTLRANFRLLPRTQLTTTATLTTVRGARRWSGVASLNIVIGRGTTASATYSNILGTETKYLDINKSLPVGVGMGYRLTGSDVEKGTAGGQFELNTPVNRLRLNYDAMDGGDRTNGSATLSGGLIVTGGGVFFTRPLDSSVAVVEVTGLKGVGILADNVLVARTNGRGTALIPRLLPYLANRISYVESDIPFDYTVPVTSQLIAPPYRGAAHVRFVTSRIQARTGSIRLTIDGEEVVPSYGTIVVVLDGEEVESPLNIDGEFFLDLPNGHHTGTVNFKGQSCGVEFNATAKTGLMQKVGILRCTP